jgi:hypothetical protein
MKRVLLKDGFFHRRSYNRFGSITDAMLSDQPAKHLRIHENIAEAVRRSAPRQLSVAKGDIYAGDNDSIFLSFIPISNRRAR